MNRLLGLIFAPLFIVGFSVSSALAQEAGPRTQIYGLSSFLSYYQNDSGPNPPESLTDSKVINLLQKHFDLHSELGSIRIDQLDYVRLRRDISSLLVRATNEEHQVFARLFYAAMNDIPQVVCQCRMVRVAPTFQDELRKLPMKFETIGDRTFAHMELQIDSDGLAELFKSWGIDRGAAVSHLEFRSLSDSPSEIQFDSLACQIKVELLPHANLEANKIGLNTHMKETQKFAPKTKPLHHSFQVTRTIDAGSTLLVADLTPTSVATNQPATLKLYFFSPQISLSNSPMLLK